MWQGSELKYKQSRYVKKHMQSLIDALIVGCTLRGVKVGPFFTQKTKKSAKKLQTEKIHNLSDSEASSIKTMKVIFVYYAILLSFLWILQKNILALVCIGPIRKQQTAKG